MIVRYLLGQRELLQELGDPPRRGDEVGLDGVTYWVARVVWHRPMCPPDVVNVYLQLSEPG